MEFKDHSPILRKVKHQIAEILKENNIVGIVQIANGVGMGDFGLYLDTAEWSGISFNEFGLKLKLRSTTPEEQQNSEKTINSLIVLKSMMGSVLVILDQLEGKIREQVEIISKGPAEIHPEDNLFK